MCKDFGQFLEEILWVSTHLLSEHAKINTMSPCDAKDPQSSIPPKSCLLAEHAQSSVLLIRDFRRLGEDPSGYLRHAISATKTSISSFHQHPFLFVFNGNVKKQENKDIGVSMS